MNENMNNKYYKWIENYYKKGYFLLKTSDFPSVYFIHNLEKNKLIFSLRQGYYCILFNGRSEIDTVKHYFYDILKIILNDKFGVKWYISDETAINIQNNNLKDYSSNISIRTQNGKSMNFLLIDLPDFKVNILNRTDKNIGDTVYAEFRGMRIKYKVNNFGLITNNIETKIKKDENNPYNTILKIIIDEGICNIEDILYLSDILEKDLQIYLKKLICDKLIYLKNKNYSIFRDFISNKDCFKQISCYFESKDRKNKKNIYIISNDNIFYNDIFKLNYNLEDLNESYIKNISEKYKKIKKNEKFLKNEKLHMIFKSAELEGFGGTYADTKKLIEENIKPLGMNEKDKNILLNIKDAFDYIITTNGKVDIIEVNNLIQRNITPSEKLGVRRKGLDVKISNSIYFPMKGKDIDLWGFNDIIKIINDNKYKGVGKAFMLLMLISFVQVFYDGNKRTARIISNAILYKNNLPFVNFSSIEKLNYDKSIVAFYETGNLTYFKKYFIQSFMQGCIRVDSNNLT